MHNKQAWSIRIKKYYYFNGVRIWTQNQLENINLTTRTNNHFFKNKDCIFILFTYKRDKIYNYFFIYTLLEFRMSMDVLEI